MSDVAIGVEGLSKQHRIGKRKRYKALRDACGDGPGARSARGSAWHNSEQEQNPGDLIWGLKDVSFERVSRLCVESRNAGLAADAY
jgi:hypothetical protein